MRVLFVIHFPVFGGPHNQALRLAEPLRARGWDTVVLLPDEHGNAAERLRDAGIEVVTMPLHRLRASTDPRLHVELLAGIAPEVQAIRRVIRQRSIDLVQVGGLVNPHAAIAARLERIPVVWQLLDTRAPLPLAIIGMAFVRLLADAVMSTGWSVSFAHPGGPGIADRTVPFFPPVDTELFRPRPEERAQVRSEWGVPEGSLVVGCVANINPQKGIVDLIHAFALVRNRVSDARLVLVGAEYATHAAYSARVRAAIAGARLIAGRDVIFAGERSDVERQLSGMDVFAFAPVARGEGISTVVLEAMSSGLPVVVSAVAGLPDAIAGGSSGYLVPPDDPGSMADAVVGLLLSPTTSADIGQAARKRAIEMFGVARCAADHIEAYGLALTRLRHQPNSRDPNRPTAWDLLVCPECRAALEPAANSLACLGCKQAYPVVDGIPVMLSNPAASSHDEIDHGQPLAAHKANQADHFDHAVSEQFEVSRPHGTPRLYRFFLLEKFRRSVAPIRPFLKGTTALTVCGGSGMDAEYLARAGASVISTDISIGAARRARARALRFGLDLTPVVADAEHLPFADAAFELVYVHDGLHHLEWPVVALREMARVASRWVSVTEPARALATSAAVRAGISQDREESGNLVNRLTTDEISGVLSSDGFRPLVARRYAMYYRHQPGAVVRALSLPGIFSLARVGWWLGNLVLGRVGNKLVVLAQRDDIDPVRGRGGPKGVDAPPTPEAP